MDIHILFVANKASVEWQNFCSLMDDKVMWPLSTSRQHNNFEQRLAENVWLISVADGLPFLGQLVSSAKNSGVKYKFSVILEKPIWIET